LRCSVRTGKGDGLRGVECGVPARFLILVSYASQPVSVYLWYLRNGVLGPGSTGVGMGWNERFCVSIAVYIVSK
jgi:hypothetical protein